MALRTAPKKPNKTKTKRKAISGGGGLTKNRKLNLKLALPLIAILALVGGYTVFRSFAAEPGTTTLRNGKLFVIGQNNALHLDVSTGATSEISWMKSKGLKFYNDIQSVGFSNDGTRIFVVEPEDTQAELLDKRYVLSAYDAVDGGNRKILVDAAESTSLLGEGRMPWRIKVTPDGKSIFFNTVRRYDDGSIRFENGKILAVNIDGTNLRVIADDYDQIDIDITFDNKLYYSSVTDTDNEQTILDLTTGEKSKTERLMTPSFSPVDNRVYVHGLYGDSLHVPGILNYKTNEFIILDNNIDGSHMGTTEPDGGRPGYIRWSPDGKLLYSEEYNNATSRMGMVILDSITGKVVKRFDGIRAPVTAWQPAPPEEAPIDSKKPEEPAPLSNAEYVNYIYQTCLARVPDSAGASYWTDKLDNGMSRTEFYTTFVNTQEAKDKALCTGSIPPTPAPDPTEPEQPPVDSKKPEEETPAPPPAPTAYAEPASKLVIPNTPYILRTKTSTGPAILIRASAYGTGQYVRLSDKAAVTSFLQTQKDLGKSVKTCVSHLPVNSSNAKLVIKRLNSTSQMISVPRSPAYGDLCTTAIPVTSTMVTNPNLTTVSATGYDVTIDMITLRAE